MVEPKYNVSCLLYVGSPTDSLRERLHDLRGTTWDTRAEQRWGVTITVDPMALADVGKYTPRYRRYDKCQLIEQRNHIERMVRMAIFAVDSQLGGFGIKQMGLRFELSKKCLVHAHGTFTTSMAPEKHEIAVKMFYHELTINCGRTLVEWLPSETNWDAYCAKDEETTKGLAWALPMSLTPMAIDVLCRRLKLDVKPKRSFKKLSILEDINGQVQSPYDNPVPPSPRTHEPQAED